jgi:hypothetical protein
MPRRPVPGRASVFPLEKPITLVMAFFSLMVMLKHLECYIVFFVAYSVIMTLSIFAAIGNPHMCLMLFNNWIRPSFSHSPTYLGLFFFLFKFLIDLVNYIIYLVKIAGLTIMYLNLISFLLVKFECARLISYRYLPTIQDGLPSYSLCLYFSNISTLKENSGLSLDPPHSISSLSNVSSDFLQ